MVGDAPAFLDGSPDELLLVELVQLEGLARVESRRPGDDQERNAVQACDTPAPGTTRQTPTRSELRARPSQAKDALCSCVTSTGVILSDWSISS
jgi:hypothetical protein